jgi:hypothetical protein
MKGVSKKNEDKLKQYLAKMNAEPKPVENKKEKQDKKKP